MRIAVVDGQGGGIGKALVEKIKSEIKEADILALGTNANATAQMMRGGADDGATGENAIVINMSKVDVVVGVIAIIVANSMLGELTPAMAGAIGSSSAYKVLLPINRCNIHVVSLAPEARGLGTHIENAVEAIKAHYKAMT